MIYLKWLPMGKTFQNIFTNSFKVRPPLGKDKIQRVNVDFNIDMLKELDAVAKALNISRQAVIKTYIRQALDQHYLAWQTAFGKRT